MGKGRAPCCDKTKVKRGPWSPEEDLKLIAFIHENGHENWRAVPKQAGLLRCGKSCRLRWINYLRPDVKRGNFIIQEEEAIIKLHKDFGNKWSKIASYLPGRTDNEIKNVWNTHLKKRLIIRNSESSVDESKMESSITSTSSSESFSTNKEPNLAKTIPNSELNEQAFQVTMSKKIEHDSEKHVSNEVISITEDPKESSTSFSFDESNILNSSQIVTFTLDQQLCSPLTYLGPYDVDNNNINNTLQEVDKPNHLIEIPWDSDEDFWKLIDNFESLQSSEVQLEGVPHNQTSNHVQESVQDGENMKWSHEFDNEFGIVGETNESNKDQFLPKNYAAELGVDPHTFDLGVMERTESELDLRNIQLWLMA